MKVKDLVVLKWEAEGYYSGATASTATIVGMDFFNKNEDEIRKTEDSFYELDGKHSCVMAGVQVFKLKDDPVRAINEFNDAGDMFEGEIAGVEFDWDGPDESFLELLRKAKEEYMTKDCKGNDVMVGDTIGYVVPTTHDMGVGEVYKITKSGVSIKNEEYNGWGQKSFGRLSKQIIKIGN